MSSKEIVIERKKIEKDFQSRANIVNGQLTRAREEYEAALKTLQKKCPHIWDNEEAAIQRLNDDVSICVICKKKIK